MRSRACFRIARVKFMPKASKNSGTSDRFSTPLPKEGGELEDLVQFDVLEQLREALVECIVDDFICAN